MTIIVVFILVIFGIAAVWLSRQRLMSKPWLETGLPAMLEDEPVVPTAKIGLGVFLVVVGALFALLGSAFFMRMPYSDWQHLTLPRIIWFNTALLVASSGCLQLAVYAARKGEIKLTRNWLGGGGVTALGFLAGQLLAWNALVSSGLSLGPNPTVSFFYLITGLHGLHILGGLVALFGTLFRAVDGADQPRLRLSTELCAIYWHGLLVVWMAVVLLLGWGTELGEILPGHTE